MLKDLRGMSLDRDRAIRAIALIGLVVLGLMTLPGLLETPAPPPVPPDVGFTPQELARFAQQPLPGDKEAGAGRQSHVKRQPKREPLPRSQRPKRSKPKGKPKPVPETPAAEVETAPSTPPVPTFSTPAPAPAPSAAVSAPQYSAPAPAPPPLPADGSQEFAPR